MWGIDIILVCSNYYHRPCFFRNMTLWPKHYDLNPVFSVLTGNFNVRSWKWWNLDHDSYKGNEVDSITSTARYNQLIEHPTHIAKTCFCVDLIFSTSPSLIKETDVAFSFFEKCYHDLIFGKLSFKSIFLFWIKCLRNAKKNKKQKKNTTRKWV